MKYFVVFILIFNICGCASMINTSVREEMVVFKDTTGISDEYLRALPEIDITKEKFILFAPNNSFNKTESQLWVFIHAGDYFEMPFDWYSFCEKNNIVLLAPLDVGNKQKLSRRIEVSVLGTLKAIKEFRINKDNVYISGYSGGGRVASITAFYFPEIYKGCLGICGIDYIREMQFDNIDNPDHYGYFDFSGNNSDRVKDSVIFLVLTGQYDFRYEYLKVICKDGYQKDGFDIELIDIPNYEHRLPDTSELQQVFDRFNAKRN